MGVKVTAYVAIGLAGCKVEDTYETGYTKEEWGNLTQEEREIEIQGILDMHLENRMDCGAWVED